MSSANEEFARKLSLPVSGVLILVGIFLIMYGLTNGMRGLAGDSDVNVNPTKDAQTPLTDPIFTEGTVKIFIGGAICLLGVSLPSIIRNLAQMLDGKPQSTDPDGWITTLSGPHAPRGGQSPPDSSPNAPPASGQSTPGSTPAYQAVAIRCRDCSALNPEHARFCNQCGRAL